MMREFKLPVVLLILPFCLMLTSCDVFEGVFKLGVWSGVIMVVAIIVLLLWIFMQFRKK